MLVNPRPFYDVAWAFRAASAGVEGLASREVNVNGYLLQLYDVPPHKKRECV